MTDVVGTVADLISSTGTKFYLCETAPTITGVEEDDLDAFDALVWVEVGMVESIGEFGPEGTIGTFMPLGTGVACKYRGTTDNGEVQLSIAKTTTDTGLAALIGRQGNPVEAAFKVELSAVGTTTEGHLIPAKHQRYVFLGLVKSARITVGTGDDVVKVSVGIPITGDIIEGAKANSQAGT
jgi:hypothetical protein